MRKRMRGMPTRSALITPALPVRAADIARDDARELSGSA
jgi:hypothetical protein